MWLSELRQNVTLHILHTYVLKSDTSLSLPISNQCTFPNPRFGQCVVWMYCILCVFQNNDGEILSPLLYWKHPATHIHLRHWFAVGGFKVHCCSPWSKHTRSTYTSLYIQKTPCVCRLFHHLCSHTSQPRRYLVPTTIKTSSFISPQQLSSSSSSHHIRPSQSIVLVMENLPTLLLLAALANTSSWWEKNPNIYKTTKQQKPPDALRVE